MRLRECLVSFYLRGVEESYKAIVELVIKRVPGAIFVRALFSCHCSFCELCLGVRLSKFSAGMAFTARLL